MKLKRTVSKRNPFVQLALFRKAGSHRKSEKTARQAAKKEVV